MGAVAESYMTNGLLPYMVKHLCISSYIIRKPTSEFPHIMRKICFFFISVYYRVSKWANRLL